MLLLLTTLSAFAAQPPTAPDLTDPEQKLTTQLQIVEGLIENGMYQQALEAVTSLRADGAKDPRFDLLQALAMNGVGLGREAEQVLTTHLRKHPRDADAWALLGVMHADAGRLEDSIAALRRARRLRPDDPDVLNNLGFVLLAHGDIDESVTLFRASLQYDPAQLRARNNLGFALARLERDPEALEAFRSAGPETAAQYNLGVACELRGDHASAINHYQAAVSARPDNAEASAALARLLTKGSP